MGLINVVNRAINLRAEGYCHDPAHCFERALIEEGQVYERGVLTQEDLDVAFTRIEKFRRQMDWENSQAYRILRAVGIVN